VTTGLDIVTQALKKSGILGSGGTASASDQNDALADLNDMLAQARRQRFLVFNELDIGFTSTGAFTYTVGPGGDYDVTPRPNRIQAAYVRQIQAQGLQVDQPLSVVDSREQYSRIATKQLVSFPQLVYLETALPLGILHPYPCPNASIYSIHLILKDTLPNVGLQTNLSGFPEEYIPWMKFNLARRLRQAYGKGMKPDPELNILANDAIDVVVNANLQIDELVMPGAVLPRGSGYNIYSDQFGQ
jgi:hypothetical protein